MRRARLQQTGKAGDPVAIALAMMLMAVLGHHANVLLLGTEKAKEALRNVKCDGGRTFKAALDQPRSQAVRSPHVYRDKKIHVSIGDSEPYPHPYSGRARTEKAADLGFLTAGGNGGTRTEVQGSPVQRAATVVGLGLGNAREISRFYEVSKAAGDRLTLGLAQYAMASVQQGGAPLRTSSGLMSASLSSGMPAHDDVVQYHVRICYRYAGDRVQALSSYLVTDVDLSCFPRREGGSPEQRSLVRAYQKLLRYAGTGLPFVPGIVPESMIVKTAGSLAAMADGGCLEPPCAYSGSAIGGLVLLRLKIRGLLAAFGWSSARVETECHAS